MLQSTSKPLWYVIQLVIISLIIAINSVVSYIVQTNGVPFIQNQSPFGVFIPLAVIATIITVVCVGFWYFNLLEIYTIASILILSGSFSNGIERFALGYVRDYIYLPFTVINIADLQIWVGLILLNIQLWKRYSAPRSYNQY